MQLLIYLLYTFRVYLHAKKRTFKTFVYSDSD